MLLIKVPNAAQRAHELQQLNAAVRQIYLDVSAHARLYAQLNQDQPHRHLHRPHLYQHQRGLLQAEQALEQQQRPQVIGASALASGVFVENPSPSSFKRALLKLVPATPPARLLLLFPLLFPPHLPHIPRALLKTAPWRQRPILNICHLRYLRYLRSLLTSFTGVLS